MIARSLLARQLVHFAQSAFVVAAVFLTVLHISAHWGGIDPITAMLSDYALRPGWWMWDGALLATSVGSVAVLVALHRQHVLRGWFPAVCLLLWCVSVALIALFAKDPQGGAITPTGKVHLYATAVSCASLPGAAWVLGRAHREHLHWHRFARWSRRLALGSLPFFLPFIIPFAIHTFFGGQLLPMLPTGLIERLMAGLQLGLLIVLGTWARRATVRAHTAEAGST
jgi:hypothetical protein